MSKHPRRRPTPERFEVIGNRGGSFVAITSVRDGMVQLEVGETCLHTIDQEISVAALAAILTWAKDYGFQKIVDEYVGQGGGVPFIKVDQDVTKQG